MLANLLPVCIICQYTPEEGIRGGIVVSGHFLCDECQQEIVAAQVGEPRYDTFVQRLKRIWV